MSRLIDADALIHELNNSHYLGAPYIDAGISIAIGKVCDAPTIEPERKKGRWEMLQISINPPVYKCSVCGGHALQTVTGCLINRHLEANLTDFCPNCGADMNGKVESDGKDT